MLVPHGISKDLKQLSHCSTFGVSLETKHTKNGVGIFFKHLKRTLALRQDMLDSKM